MLSYNAVSQTTKVAGNEEGNEDKIMVKLTKPERREKLKKSRKEAKKQGKELAKTEEVRPTQQEAALAEVKEDLTAEEAFESKKQKPAELGMALLADPEANIKSLKEMLQFAKDGNHSIVKLGLLSLLAVFEDITPGYRIRLPTEKEMKVSKEVKKMRYYESTLLSAYKGYLQKLLALEKQPIFHHVVETLLWNYIKSLFTNEGKHGGEATVEAVQFIADHVKAHDCQLHPDSVEDFFVQLYNLVLEYRPGNRDQSEVLAEALKIKLCDDRQHDMQKAAAFVKA
ncbi:hypothetical protein CRYUN_Cryun38cG0018200 [Craigia yunnanensis]